LKSQYQIMYRHTGMFVGTLRVADGDTLGTIITQPLDCDRKVCSRFRLQCMVYGKLLTATGYISPVAFFVGSGIAAVSGAAVPLRLPTKK